MTRRTEARQGLICLQLLQGPATLRRLAEALGRWRWTTILDLADLTEVGTIVETWQQTQGWPAGRVTYRLATDADRAEREETVRRLRAAFHAVTEPIRLDEPGDDGSAR